jgi:hypothetical protein
MIYLLASDEILKIIGGWDTLRLRSSQEVLHDGVRVISKRNLDWALKAMNISAMGVRRGPSRLCDQSLPVIGCPLVCLMLLHERNELLCSPSLGLEVIVVGSRCSSVHHEVDG